MTANEARKEEIQTLITEAIYPYVKNLFSGDGHFKEMADAITNQVITYIDTKGGPDFHDNNY